MNPKTIDYSIDYISLSDTEILFIEKIEDSFISVERKNFIFKLMRHEKKHCIQEASISVDLTSLIEAPGL